jgi:hypothetical protein
MQSMVPIHEAVRQALDTFRERTGLDPVRFLAQKLGISEVTAYQWQEANGDGARRNISAQKAVAVTDVFNLKYKALGLKPDHSLIAAICAAAGCVCVEPPDPNGVKATIPVAFDGFNGVIQAIYQSLADDRITRKEIRDIHTSIDHCVRVLEQLSAQAQAKADEDARHV